MLGLILLAETLLAANRADIVSPSAEDWRFAAWAATHKAPAVDVLCLGDSLVKYGVLPRVIEERTGLRAYNLATSGGTMQSEYFLLKRALAAGAQPRAIVADFLALMLDDQEALSLLNYAELATLRDAAELAWVEHDAHFLAASSLARLLPSCRWRFEVRDLIMATLRGQSGSRRPLLTEIRQRWERNQGAQPMPPGRVRHPSEDFLIDGVSPARWTIHPRNLAYLDRFLALAEAHQIPVYWLIPPLVPEAHARRAQRGADAAYDGLVRAELARHPGVVVLDARRSGYDDSVHIDHIHLDRVGAAALSTAIGAIVADRTRGQTAPNPWINLPPCALPVATAQVASRPGEPAR